MRASDLMTHPVITVSTDTPVKQAAQLLLDRGFTALPVLDARERLVGVASEADLIRNRILPDPRALIGATAPPEPAPAGLRVAEVMTPKSRHRHPQHRSRGGRRVDAAPARARASSRGAGPQWASSPGSTCCARSPATTR